MSEATQFVWPKIDDLWPISLPNITEVTKSLQDTDTKWQAALVGIWGQYHRDIRHSTDSNRSPKACPSRSVPKVSMLDQTTHKRTHWLPQLILLAGERHIEADFCRLHCYVMRCYGEASWLDTFIFHQLRHNMEYHEGISTDAPPHRKGCFYFELELNWGAHTSYNGSPQRPEFEPRFSSVLSLSCPIICLMIYYVIWGQKPPILCAGKDFWFAVPCREPERFLLLDDLLLSSDWLLPVLSATDSRLANMFILSTIFRGNTPGKDSVRNDCRFIFRHGVVFSHFTTGWIKAAIWSLALHPPSVWYCRTAPSHPPMVWYCSTAPNYGVVL